MYLQKELEGILEGVLIERGLHDPQVEIDKFDFVPDGEAPVRSEDGQDCFQVVVWMDGDSSDTQKKLSLVFPAPTAQQAQDPDFIQALMEGTAQTLNWMAGMKLRQGGQDG